MKFSVKKIFSSGTAGKRTIFFIIGDFILIELAVYLAFLLRFDGKIPSTYPSHIESLFGLLMLAPIILIPMLFWQKIYWMNWSYVSVKELISLVRGVSSGFILIGAIIIILRESWGLWPMDFFRIFFATFARSTIFISFFLVFLFLGGFRISKRVFLQFQSRNVSKNGTKLLIVGAGDAGEQVLRNILITNQGKYNPIGFVDDSISKIGTTIHDLKVLGKVEEIPGLKEKFDIEEVIIAAPTAPSRFIRNTVRLCRESGIQKIKIIPSLAELLSEKITMRDLREVQIDDLLGRDPVSLDQNLLKAFIFGKTILVTGAAGSIGSELCRQVAKFNPSGLVALDWEESNLFLLEREIEAKFPKLNFQPIICGIQQKAKIDKIFFQVLPQIVFHAAAYKHVPLMEKHPEEAIRNNVLGTLVVGEAAIKAGVKNFVLISTDKAVKPISVMGASKRLAEMAVQYLNEIGVTKFIAVRFGNVLDSRGSVVPIFREQIKRGGPVTVTHPEMKRYFMAPAEAITLVLQAGAMGSGGEIFTLDMGEAIKITDLAREMIKFSGFSPDKDIPIVFTGIRPGEKLFENLFADNEEKESTLHPKIFKTRIEANHFGENFLDELQNLLKENGESGNSAEILKNKLKRFVPDYLPRS